MRDIRAYIGVSAIVINAATFEDAFNLLCGNKIGAGAYRDVFACRLLPDCVVKVEQPCTWRTMHNFLEMKLWSDVEHRPDVKKWLAPVRFCSPDNRILIMERVAPLRSTDALPDRLPAFLTDIKRENFGILDNRLVCVDYALYINNVVQTLKKVTWDD